MAVATTGDENGREVHLEISNLIDPRPSQQIDTRAILVLQESSESGGEFPGFPFRFSDIGQSVFEGTTLRLFLRCVAIEYFTHSTQQLLLGERLRDEVGLRSQCLTTFTHVRVARHVQSFRLRAGRSQTLCQSRARHVRHNDIGQQQMDLPCVFFASRKPSSPSLATSTRYPAFSITSQIFCRRAGSSSTSRMVSEPPRTGPVFASGESVRVLPATAGR